MDISQSKIKNLIRDAMITIDGNGSNSKLEKYFEMVSKYYLEVKKPRKNIHQEIAKALTKGIRAEYGFSYKLNIHTLMHWINSEIKESRNKKINL